jgi:ABC-type amino acid transport substrate-binding protein
MTRNHTIHWRVRHAGTLRALGLAVVLVVSLLSGCQGQTQLQAGSVQLKGSETLRPLLTMCAEDFMTRHPHAVLASAFTAVRLQHLIKGPEDLAWARVAVVTGTSGEELLRR